jgi:rubrerythrin
MRNDFFRHLDILLRIPEEGKENDAPMHNAKGASAGADSTASNGIPAEFNAKDWLVFLLHVDAELEHSLMVQYLYAAYSMGGEHISSDEDRKLVRKWQEIILGIAKEEMGHFITVQNVLKALGAPLNFNRQNFPFDSKMYPFEFKLEPLTRDSLAKYIFAESPAGWLNIKKEAAGKKSEELVLADFLKKVKTNSIDEIPEAIKEDIRKRLVDGFEKFGDPVSELFAEILRIIKNPKLIPDKAFKDTTYPQQAKWDEWGRGYKGGARGNTLLGDAKGTPDVLVLPITSRSQAIAALSQIAEQGESTSTLDTSSHLMRFISIYAEWMQQDELNPARNVAINPTLHLPSTAEQDKDDQRLRRFKTTTTITYTQVVTPITDPLAIQWSNLFNIRYRMLLNFLMHSFLLDDGNNNAGSHAPRGAIINATFGEMYNLRSISNILVRTNAQIFDPLKLQIPILKAGPPFTLPYTMALPTEEPARWGIHLDLIEATESIAKALMMEFPAADDPHHIYLRSLLEADLVIKQIAEKIAARA